MNNFLHKIPEIFSNFVLKNSKFMQRYLKENPKDLSLFLEMKKSIKNLSQIHHQKKTEDSLDENLLAGYYDGQLSSSEKKKVETYIKNSEVCVQDLLFLYSFDEKSQTKGKKTIKKVSSLKTTSPFLALKLTKKGFEIISSTFDFSSITPDPVLMRFDSDNFLAVKKASFQVKVNNMIFDTKFKHLDAKDVKMSILFHNIGNDVLVSLYKEKKKLKEKNVENDYVTFILQKGFYRIEVSMSNSVFFFNLQIK